MATRRGRQQSRSQLGETMLVGGLGALILTPVVYRIRTAGAHTQAGHWVWPTWWMLVPLVIAVVGGFLVLMPESFDLRRSVLHSRLVTRLRRRS